MVTQGKPKAGTSEWFDEKNYLPQCRYTFHRQTGGGERCTARAVRNGLNYCPEHRCWYHDEAGMQCENGMNTNVFCTAHVCRVKGCDARAATPSSYCLEHAVEPCLYVDELGNACPKDPRDGGEYCSKRHRARARAVRKAIKDKAALRASQPPPEPEGPDPDLLLINPKCTCLTSFGLPIRHYYTNIECPDRVREPKAQVSH